MTPIRFYYEGLPALLRECPENQIGLVTIPSSSQVVTALMMLTERIALPSDRKFVYIPPYESTHRPDRPRRPSVPSIPSNMTIVVHDDTIEYGHTLAAAVQMLSDQGIPIERVWFLSEVPPYLEKAGVVLAHYLKDRKESPVSSR